ncbi:MAG TPA: amino acid ABC transporter permease [Actinomycetota bacterium]|nr:amino acid ABC transporter permease [Actinomycetota bacterium]
MTTDGTGAATRPPFTSEPDQGDAGGPGRLDRWAHRSASVPFRLKVAFVWIGIFLVLGFLFWAAAFDRGWIRDNIWFIARGLVFTLAMAAFGIVLAVVLALVGALGRLSRNPIAYGISGFYTSFFRGTPLLVQLFLFYLAMPRTAANLFDRFQNFLPQGFDDFFIWTSFQVGVLVLGLNYGAYMTEIFRAGIQSVSHGQSEAADALGMTYRQKMRRVVLPQAFRVVIPPTGNEFIAMMKDTALVSVLGQSIESMELFRRAQLLGNADVKPLEALVTAAGLYWALTAIFTFFQSRLERRVSRGYVRAAPGGRRARERGKVVVTGSGGGERGAPSGYVLDAPESPEVPLGHTHAGGTGVEGASDPDGEAP